MEYIQCTHCHKKYRVNEQVRAAEGRMVTCKDCQHPIEIIIQHDADTPQEPVQNKPQEEPIQQPRPSRPQRKRQAPQQKKRTGMQWLSLCLGTLLIAASAYIFFQGRSEQAKALHTPTHTEQAPVQRAAAATPNLKHPDSCKQAAAQQWFADFALAHGRQQGTEYMQLLDQSIHSSALVRTYCKHAQVVTEILTAAQHGTPPTWLQPTLAQLTQQEDMNLNTPHF